MQGVSQRTERALPDTAIGKLLQSLLTRPSDRSARPQTGPVLLQPFYSRSWKNSAVYGPSQAQTTISCVMLAFRRIKPQMPGFCLWKAQIPAFCTGLTGFFRHRCTLFQCSFPPYRNRSGTKLDKPHHGQNPSSSRFQPRPVHRRKQGAETVQRKDFPCAEQAKLCTLWRTPPSKPGCPRLRYLISPLTPGAPFVRRFLSHGWDNDRPCTTTQTKPGVPRSDLG